MAHQNSPKEIALKRPKSFDGNRANFRSFWESALLYLTVNEAVYDNSVKRIGFVLSFMDKGGAAIWRQNFLEEEEARRVKTTWDEFKDALKNLFEPKDEIAIGIEALKDIQQGQKLALETPPKTTINGEPTNNDRRVV